MRRREFITLLGGGAAAWPVAARAQQLAKPSTIGLLGSGTPAVQGQWWMGFVERLRGLGWVEGRTVAIEHRWAEGRSERMAEIAVEFVRRKVDAIVTSGTLASVAVAQARLPVPLVFVNVSDPVGTGLVASLARPGGNITGLSGQQVDVAGKRLELLREVVPALHSLAVFANVNNPANLREMDEVLNAARPFALDVTPLEVRAPKDIAPAFEALKVRPDAVYVCGDTLTITNLVRLNTLTLTARLPTIFNARENVEAGGLMSYGTNVTDMFRRAAELLDKILRGTKPADIPVEQPTKFELVINLTTAKALGLGVPETFLLRADEAIE
jgi:putative ABC transport system substrate-binding protein